MKVVHVGSLLVCGWLTSCVGGGPPDDAPFCGGFAGIPCEGAGVCVDDPSDDCDPNQGGADCGGICECQAIGLCAEGSRWDSSPSVCGCVPDSNPCAVVLCPTGTQCSVQDGKAICVGGDPCGDVTCGPGLQCCNASCSICLPPGRACIQIACE
jgi:hypothetical protein